MWWMLAIGIVIGVLLGCFMSITGQNNKNIDYYNEGWIDGFNAGKRKGGEE